MLLTITSSLLFQITDELRRLRKLVIDAKENGIKVVIALVKRMLVMNMFLFGSVDIAGGSVTQRVEEITKLQNKHIQIACEKYRI